MASTRLLPGKSQRDSRKARATPSGRLAMTLQKATLRLRTRASVSAGERLHTASVYGEAVLLENATRLRVGQEFEELAGARFRALQRRHGIHDRRVAVG